MIRLNIGPEAPLGKKDAVALSRHLINLKNVDKEHQQKAHASVTVDLKKEIELKVHTPEKIHVVGKNVGKRKGLGRIPMLMAALAMILFLNVGQMVFLGRHQGEEALALAAEGFLSLKGASQSFVSGESGADVLLFDQANELFNQAKSKGAFLLSAASPWMDEPGPVQSLSNVLEAGSLMAEVGKQLSGARNAFQTLPTEGSLTQYLGSVSTTHLEPAAAHMKTIQNLLSTVDLSGTPYATELVDYKEKLNALSALLQIWISAKTPLLTALGDQTPQTYLILLESNDEMRLGGGFIGSLALVTLNDGHLSPIDFHDVYEFDNRYFKHQEVPVPELQSLTTQWRLRDSNIFVDFPRSAQKATWFLEEEGGPGVDGVIAVNLSAAQAFLETLGPLSVPSLPKPLTAENFPTVLSALVESKTYGKTTPKAILKEVLTAFAAQLSDSKKAALLGQSAWQEIQKKQVLFYSKNPQVQDLFVSLGMDGGVPTLGTIQGDFFLPTFTNIGGNKTDRYIDTQISHDTQLLEDGSMVATISLTRTNTFNDQTLNWLKKTTSEYGLTAWTPQLEATLGKAPNKTGIRFYVPEGSRLMESSGLYRDEVRLFYDATQDLSYFYFDQTLDPGESKTLSLQFALPMKFQGNFQEYHFQWFKQPGLKSILFEKTVTAPHKTLLSASLPATRFTTGTDYTRSGNLEGDIDFTLLYQ